MARRGGWAVLAGRWVGVLRALMPAIDNLLLFRCVQIVRRLTQKNRDIGVFCNISGDTLTDAEFFPQFLEYMHHNRDLGPHITFEFAQDAVMKAGARGEENQLFKVPPVQWQFAHLALIDEG